MPLSVDDFDYHLPPELIAQEAAEPRESARLLVIEVGKQAFHHTTVANLPQYLHTGDRIVFNETKVIPARLFGNKPTGGEIEVLLVHPEDDLPRHWRCMTKGKVRVGTDILLGDTRATVTALHADGERTLQFPEATDVLALADAIGHIPLPPYIKREDTAADKERYQTVFAKQPGSVAAPTAALHFTDDLLSHLTNTGIDRSFVDLSVGPGTFKPVSENDISAHVMHAERCSCPAATVADIEATKAAGGRIIAVGTTVIRTLESAAQHGNGQLVPFADWTSIFCYPPYKMQVADGLLTNFHLPRSTLLMLVACLTGVELLQDIYQRAIAERYRFYSYGDAMLILP